MSGGTDNHLVLVSLIDKGLTGKDADAALSRANITVNKNTVPNDPCSPFVTSGLRLGTPAITTRGFGLNEFKTVGELITKTLPIYKNGGSNPLIFGIFIILVISSCKDY